MSHPMFDCALLIIDDQPMNVELLTDLLKREGFQRIFSSTRAQDTLNLYHQVKPDLILLDLLMPELDGFAVLEQLSRHITPNSYLPILVLTADATRETKHRALALGAKDFMTKPFDALEVMLRVTNLLETRLLFMELAKRGIASPIPPQSSSPQQKTAGNIS